MECDATAAECCTDGVAMTDFLIDYILPAMVLGGLVITVLLQWSINATVKDYLRDAHSADSQSDHDL